MASKDEVKNAIIAPMMARFKAPQGVENPGLVLDEYVEDLQPYGHLQLVQAWKHLRQHHPKTTWPLMSEIKEAIRETAEPSIIARAAEPDDDNGYWRKIARNSEFWDEALKNGVPWFSESVVCRGKRKPRFGDVQRAMENKVRFIADVEEAERKAQANPHSLTFAPLGRAMIEHNEKLVREAA